MRQGYDYSAHIGYLFTEHPLAERVALAARHGFRAIEHPAPYAIPPAEMARLLTAAGLAYTQFGLRSGNAAKGEKGIAIFPDRRVEFRETLAEALDYAEITGVRMLHAMAGILPEDQRRAEHWDCYVANLSLAARAAAPRGVTIILEPMSALAVPDYFIDTPDRARAAIRAAGEPNLGLLLDLFHTVATGLDIRRAIAENAALLRHVHIADFPGRHEPGSVALDLDQVEDWLARAGYSGRIGCEYQPAARTEAGLGWLAARLSAAQAVTEGLR